MQLSSGDTIVLMSDGFPEMFNDKVEMFGSIRAGELIKEIGHKSPQEIVESLARMGDEWANGRPQQDDVTFVVLKAK